MYNRNGPVTLAAWLALCALSISATSATAQTLTKAQEGRAAVGQCYASCMARAQTTAQALYQRADRLTDLLISDEYHALTEDSQNALVRLEEDAVCALAQDHVRALDGCFAGCLDVETAYDFRRSHSRLRFRQVYIAERDALRDVGLWDDYQNSATSGSAFNAGCDRYWDGGQTGLAATSRIAALPALVGHRAAKPVRAEDPGRQPVRGRD